MFLPAHHPLTHSLALAHSLPLSSFLFLPVDLLSEKAHSLGLHCLILEQTLLSNGSSCSTAANGILRSLRNNLDFVLVFSNSHRSEQECCNLSEQKCCNLFDLRRNILSQTTIRRQGVPS